MQVPTTTPSMIDNVLNSNKYVSAIIGLFLALYAGLAAPKLPRSITSLFDNFFFKLFFMFLIAYTATKDTPVAIMSSIALLVTLQTLSSQKTSDKVVDAVKAQVDTIHNEIEKSKYIKKIIQGFSDEGPPKQLDEVMKPLTQEPEPAEVINEEPASIMGTMSNMVSNLIQPPVIDEEEEEDDEDEEEDDEDEDEDEEEPVQVPVMQTLPPPPVMQTSPPPVMQTASVATASAPSATEITNESNLNTVKKTNGCGQTVDDLMPGFDAGEFAAYVN
jgi:hypothetical protein